jgi:hypothetical protein
MCALLKEVDYKGYQAEYWMITSIYWNKIINKTNCQLSLFKDESTSREVDLSDARVGLNNQINELTKNFSFTGELDTSGLYFKIKESIPYTEIISGENLTKECNWFYDSINC